MLWSCFINSLILQNALAVNFFHWGWTEWKLDQQNNDMWIFSQTNTTALLIRVALDNFLTKSPLFGANTWLQRSHYVKIWIKRHQKNPLRKLEWRRSICVDTVPTSFLPICLKNLPHKRVLLEWNRPAVVKSILTK